MTLKKLFPLVTVKSLAPVKDFYGQHFGCAVPAQAQAFEAQGYLQLVAPGGAELAFMAEDAEAPEFPGTGLTLCFEVDDVDAEAARLEKAGLPIVRPLQDNPWGDRSIILRDPVGIHVYVFQNK